MIQTTKVVAKDRQKARSAARAKLEALGFRVVRVEKITNVVFPVYTRRRVYLVEVEVRD